MKKTMTKFLALIFVCAMTFAIPAQAFTIMASAQISSYDIDVTAISQNRIATDFSIVASGKMAVVGASKIAIYAKSGSTWSLKKTYTQSDSGMTATNSYGHMNSIVYQGQADTEYRVQVTLFAKDSTGASDSRSETFYVTL